MKKNDNIFRINKYYILIILFIISIFIIYKLIPDKTINDGNIPDVKWPFLNLKDENGKNLNMLVVRAYFDNKKEEEDFLKYIDQGFKFIGCSSNQSFPRECDNPHGKCNKKENNKINGKDIEDYVLGWCHCFKDPDKYIKKGIPRLLISESDFNSDGHLEYKTDVEIKYDYITVQPKDNDECNIGWAGYYKNWPLAEKCIKVFSDDLNLKGLVVGRDECPVNVKNKKNAETTGFLKYNDFIDKIRESKFMLLPNLEEASPRILCEALVLNKPVFVYENILGGWKYVNNDTGIFFNETNIKEKVEELLRNMKNNKYSPREYYLNNYGIKNKGKELRDFLKGINPELSDCELVRFNTS